MHVNISPTWAPILQEEFSKEYFKSVSSFVDKAYQEATCYPAKEDIFKALHQTCFNELGVVIKTPTMMWDRPMGLVFL